MTKNRDKALYWYGRAADHGYAPSQYSLGTMYEYDDPSHPDYDLARSWYQKAAARGNGKAAYELGKMYEQGLGTPKNLVAAVGWYWQGAVSDNADAKKSFSRLVLGPMIFAGAVFCFVYFGALWLLITLLNTRMRPSTSPK